MNLPAFLQCLGHKSSAGTLPFSAIRPGERAPSKRLRLAGSMFTALFVLSMLAGGWIETLESSWLDSRLQLRRGFHAEERVAEIVLIGIDEESLQQHREPLALWHRPLAETLKTLADLRPRAVGLDLALPDRSYDHLVPGSDQRLAHALAALRATTPVVLALGIEGDQGPVSTPMPLFLAAAGVENNGVALFRRDADGTVRRFTEALGPQGQRLPTLVGTLARRLGAPVGEGIIDFGRGPQFRYIPLHRLTAPDRKTDSGLAAEITGRIVLIGTTLPFLDRHQLPVQMAAWEKRTDTPGLVLQAQTLRNILGGNLIIGVSPALSALLVLLAAMSGLWPGSTRSTLVLVATAASLLTATSVAALEWQVDIPAVPALCGFALTASGRLVWQYRNTRRARAELLQRFGGFVSPTVLEALLAGRLDPFQPLRRNLVFLFADLRDFSGLSQQLTPEQVYGLLNRYYAAVTPCLHRHGGTIDNFRGDGLMAFFGAPQELEQPLDEALVAAQEMLGAVAELNRHLRQESLPALRAGVALTQGEAVIGNLGDTQRCNYTALAQAANTAAHLQSVARNFREDLIATQDIAQIQPSIWRSLGLWQLKDGQTLEVYGFTSPELQNPP